jgi:peptide/nickel transport system substrate-binding protein
MGNNILLRYFRLLTWGLKIFVVRRFKLIILILVLGTISLFLILHFKLTFPKKGCFLEIGLIGNFDSPAKLPSEVSKLLSSGLTKITPEGEATASIAFNWEVEKEGQLYTFFLDKNRLWSDGTKLKASDLKFNLPDVKIKTDLEDRIRFLLKAPFSPFPTLVSRPLFKEENLAGLGPCKVEKIEKEKEMLDYLLISCQGQEISRLGFRFYPREEAAVTALKLGEIQVLLGVSDIGPLANWPSFNFYFSPTYKRHVALFYKAQDPFLSEKAARQALTWAIPKEEFKFKAYGPISPKSWAFFTDLKKYDCNFENAHQLLTELTSPSSLTLSTVSTYQELAQNIADSWEELGIKTKIRVKTTVEEALGDFQVLLIGQEVPLDPDQYSLWHSTQEGNVTGFISPKIDKLLEDGRKTLDKMERKEIYFDFQKYLVEECPAAFLYYPEETTIIAKKVDSSKLRKLLGVKGD